MALLQFSVVLIIFAIFVDTCAIVLLEYRPDEWTKMSDMSLGVAAMSVFLELYFVLGA